MTGWIGILVCFGTVTGAVMWGDGGAASPVRHLYLVPTLWAGLRFGGLGGGLGGVLAVLLYALFVLPTIESAGLTAESLEGLVSLGHFLFVGSVTGTLAHRARVRVARVRLLLALQERLSAGGDLRLLLHDVAEQLRDALGARATAIVLVSDGVEPLVVVRGEDVSGERAFGPHSAMAWVLTTGRRVYVSDLETDQRFGRPGLAAAPPRRALMVPLRAREGSIGVLAVERHGEFPRGLRATVDTLGLQLALGIENARLADRQRRFGEELEEKIAAATRRLRELDRAKSEFVSIVSHELRTPVTSIQGFSELLLGRRVSGTVTRRFLESIHGEAERLGRIVTDLLDLARIERGGGPGLAPAPLALGPLIDTNVDLFRAQSGLHAISRAVPQSLPAVLADADATDRILKNLLSNAIKYSPAGGAIRVWARCAPGDPRRVELLVEDRGVGIPAAALPHIFDRYARISHPGTGRVRGLGLGLTLVKALVEAQNGSVRVESEEGRGSRFIVSLPVAPSPG